MYLISPLCQTQTSLEFELSLSPQQILYDLNVFVKNNKRYQQPTELPMFFANTSYLLHFSTIYIYIYIYVYSLLGTMPNPPMMKVVILY